MRLLKLEDGEFSLAEFVGNNIPRYAILSHTWGLDHEEATFKDLVDGTGKSKAGYNKIRFCGNQAAKDGLQFFWVDTCCIDKSSSTELTEAINSMFQWYHKAEKCYVYLSDVFVDGSVGSDLSSQWTWKIAFQKSRWFTRGWTLQELLAPTSVEFFSARGERLGNRISLLQEIHDATGISIQALAGSPLSQFSVDDRMSWAEGRKTKREEDAAYSLLGIFGIYMPLLYGEGPGNALTRLREGIKRKEEAIDGAILNGIWMVSTGSISFTNFGGHLAVNGKVPRNGLGQACPWDQCVHTSMGPRSAGFLPNFIGRLPVIGLNGGGMISIWAGFDETYIKNFRKDSNSWDTTTHWVEALMSPSQIVRDSAGLLTLRSTGTSYAVQGGVWQI
ncbi:MAG: Vegetative incompatibility protein HET-E-1 [Trichoglossum hirsutum]|jgi:hypothetical protein|nr:MAG: Vegetative incompatibility protein HET-E-1 [Trichoglossum hirsutum]